MLAVRSVEAVEDKNKSHVVGAIDFGIKTAATVYNASDGSVTAFGAGRDSLKKVRELDARGWHLRQAQRCTVRQVRALGKEVAAPEGERRRLHHKLQALKRRRQKNSQHRREVIRDFHRRVANELASTYDVLIVPEFPVKALVRREGRVFGPAVARDAYRWALYGLRTRIEYTCARRGVLVLTADEDWTTATCGRCGRVNRNVGGAGVFVCGECGYVCLRDDNGAFNIHGRVYSTGGRFLRWPKSVVFVDSSGEPIPRKLL